MIPPGSDRPESSPPDLDASPALPAWLFDKLLEGCQLLDFEWRYRYVNDTAAMHGRRARAELLGRRIMDVYPGIEETPMFHALRRAMVLRTASRFENRFTYDDGSHAWFDLRFVPVDGGVLILSLDVTEQQVAEAELRRSEQKYREMFDFAQVGIFRLGPAGDRLLDANLKLGEILRTSTEALLAAGGGLPWADPARFAAFLDQLEAEGRVEFAELDLLAADGSRRFCVASGVRLPNGDGIEGTLRDVTQRVSQDREHLKLVTAIHQSAEGVILTDPTGLITYVNPAFQEISGYREAEVLGRNPRFLKSGHQDDAFYQALWRTISTDGVWRGRMVNRRKDGTLYTQDSTISQVRDDDGELLGFVGVSRDVTNELELEAQLAHAQRLETIGRLAGGVAHDFNNLLAVILGSTELVLAGLADDAPWREELEEVLRAGQRASRLTRQLLAFGRRQPVQSEVVDPAAVMQAIEPMLRRLLPDSLSLAVQAADDLPSIVVDPTQLEQVLVNLAVNARDAMPDGGRLTIRLDPAELDEATIGLHPTIRGGRYVCLTVSDTGHGMDAATRARVFEPFFTTKPVGQGTGLGLSLVYGIMKQAGGGAWCYSEPGRGTTFKLFFPMTTEAVPEAEPPAEPEAGGGGELVLLVEDEPALLALTERILRSGGYRVVGVGSVRDARRAIARFGDRFALVVSDVVMPDGGGLALVRELREAGRTMPVLLVSGYADQALGDQGDTLDLPPILGKPFTAAELRQRVREMLST